jgi:hypothetical protein
MHEKNRDKIKNLSEDVYLEDVARARIDAKDSLILSRNNHDALTVAQADEILRGAAAAHAAFPHDAEIARYLVRTYINIMLASSDHKRLSDYMARIQELRENFLLDEEVATKAIKARCIFLEHLLYYNGDSHDCISQEKYIILNDKKSFYDNEEYAEFRAICLRYAAEISFRDLTPGDLEEFLSAAAFIRSKYPESITAAQSEGRLVSLLAFITFNTHLSKEYLFYIDPTGVPILEQGIHRAASLLKKFPEDLDLCQSTASTYKAGIFFYIATGEFSRAKATYFHLKDIGDAFVEDELLAQIEADALSGISEYFIWSTFNFFRILSDSDEVFFDSILDRANDIHSRFPENLEIARKKSIIIYNMAESIFSDESQREKRDDNGNLRTSRQKFRYAKEFMKKLDDLSANFNYDDFMVDRSIQLLCRLASCAWAGHANRFEIDEINENLKLLRIRRPSHDRYNLIDYWLINSRSSARRQRTKYSNKSLSLQAKRLLKILIRCLNDARPGHPETYPTYSEIASRLGLVNIRGPIGAYLQGRGLTELAEWTHFWMHPAITGLIVNKDSREPGDGFFRLFDKLGTEDQFYWWNNEIEEAKVYNWFEYL